MKTRTRWFSAVLLVVASMSASCALSDGDPWGRATIYLAVDFDQAGRLDDQGRLRTAADYAVEMRLFVVDVDELSVGLLAEGTEVAGFDPANPPEGYSLCHNGHCHAADGSLVSYEDIAISLGQASGGGESQLVVVYDVDVEPLDASVTLPTRERDVLAPGELGTVEVRGSRVELEMVVFDQLEGDRRRLPDEGVLVTAELPLPLVWQAIASGSFGDDEPLEAEIIARLSLAPNFLDLDWVGLGLLDGEQREAELSDSQPFNDHVLEALLEESAFGVTIERTEP